MSYDPTTDVGQVRLLIADTDDSNLIFTDAEIGSFLSLNSNSIYLSAASACMALASSAAKRAIAVKREGYESQWCRPTELTRLAKSFIDQSSIMEGVADEFPITDEHLESFRPEWRDTDQVVVE